MNKRQILAFLVLVLVISLAACTANPGTQVSQGNGQPDTISTTLETSENQASSTTPTSVSNLSTEQLAMGILELNDTPQEVTADQSKKLLSLWQQVQTLNSDESATSDQFQVIYEEIQNNLTPEQVSAIQRMDLNMNDLQILISKLGISITPAAGQAGGPVQPQGTPPAMMGTPDPNAAVGNSSQPNPQGTPAAQGGPGGNGNPGPAGTPPVERTQGVTGGVGTRLQSNGPNPMLLEAVIQYLQTKADG
jgi:hypothetical protein